MAMVTITLRRWLIVYDFVKFDESKVLEEAIEKYEDSTNTKLYAGDERRILLNSFMYISSVIASKANFLANQYFAKSAVLPYLQYIGEDKDVYLLPAEKSLVTIKFTISSALAFDIEIPSGTRVTPDGIHFFATKDTKVIQQGDLSVEIAAEATVSGTGHNGFTAGSINTLVDSISYISSVVNKDTSSGGSEIEDIEAYRERIQLKPYNYNTAGAEDAYIYLTKSADSSVGAVSVLNEDSSIIITILNKDGSIPNDLVVNKVAKDLSGKKVRPLADKVTVQKASEVLYSIDFSYTISNENSNNEAAIISNVTKAVNDFVLYQKSKLGVSVNPDILKNYILNAGAYTVTINSPAFIVVNGQSVAHVSGDPIIDYAGIYQVV